MRFKKCAISTITVLAGLAIQGCPTFEKTGAQGSSREISVFSNVSRQGAAFKHMEALYVYTIDTVQDEQFFIMDPVSFDQFNVHRLFKNQIFLVDLSRDDALARKVPGFFGEKGRQLLRSGESFRLLVRDTWAVGQSTLYLVGHTEAQLLSMLERTDPETARRQLEEAVFEGLTNTLFDLGDAESLSRQTARDYGWAMRLLPVFSAVADPRGNFVKYDSQDPVRLILVHWQGGELPLISETWRPILDHILDKYNDKDYVLEDETQVLRTTFQAKPAIKWEGVWQNDKYVIGGAFRAYGIHREGKSFLLIAMVYNPSGDKVPWLIQTEAILRTFETVQ